MLDEVKNKNIKGKICDTDSESFSSQESNLTE